MNLDQFQSTEEDWPQQSFNENEDLDFSSSPIMFGRQNRKRKYEIEQNNQEYYIQIQQIEEPLENQPLNKYCENSSIPIIQKKIRKNKRIQSNSINNLYQDILSSFIENTKSQKEILKKLHQCQNMKLLIDGLERTLMKIKHQLLIKANTHNQ